ncbi:MAG: ATP-dependent helicase [Phenylobacterium sp.]|uniref:ATP-dependent helicase n=1 Tax=Phenylobacterium sp. TaxID=1871053 RepID=UPI00273759E9|nr:ATP-dependent helicase [Phenylobacterium sp.]MDP3745610.1 ATP-dependent helicase [Phenylobacterium sp.]
MKLSLSTRQQEVVSHDQGAILVVAGPGSGKTRVLTERVRTLLEKPHAHFKVLALTFSNKAANEMAERLEGLGEQKQRATVSTLHGFCLELLADRGKAIGVSGQPQIFERAQDRRQVLMLAVNDDPWLAGELREAGSTKDQNLRLGDWLQEISRIKTHPLTGAPETGSFEERLLDAYNAGLAASGAYDFDDLLVLGYRLLTEAPQVADLYRRIYNYVCVDEAQDLNEAQYAVITALCGDSFRNVMMVGDPKQSIYGFNTSSPRFMEEFARDFAAKRVELTENFRSSQMVVRAARQLIPSYSVEGQLPITGWVRVMVGNNEEHEANLVVDEIERLLREGHPDIEGEFILSKCAVLGRNRYCIAAVESELKKRGMKFFRRLSAAHEYESDLIQQFLLGLRLIANPADRFHLNALLKAWGASADSAPVCAAGVDVIDALRTVAPADGQIDGTAVIDALEAIVSGSQAIRLPLALSLLKRHADGFDEEARRYVYSDAEIIGGEWDQYLRNKPSAASLGGFLSHMALGSTQQPNADGVALMTVHASKGLEFDVVFVAGLAEGIFPDYRARHPQALTEELRNAFVAATRSKRLLYLTYPKLRMMPWGDTRATVESRFLHLMQSVG